MLCREQVAQLCGRLDRIRARGAELVVVGNGSPQHAQWFREDLAVPIPVFTDPELRSYRALGARSGLLSVLHPGTFRSSWRALRAGLRQRRLMGKSLQQGAVVVVLPDGSMPYRYVSRFSGDHPDPDEVLKALPAARGPEAPTVREDRP